MSWITSQKRLTKLYIFTTAALNDCGILPDGAEIKPWIKAELGDIEPPPAQEEVDTVLASMWSEGVKFHGMTPEAVTLFDAHPLFGKAGHKLGVAQK
jgi:hypothetical protein